MPWEIEVVHAWYVMILTTLRRFEACFEMDGVERMDGLVASSDLASGSEAVEQAGKACSTASPATGGQGWGWGWRA